MKKIVAMLVALMLAVGCFGAMAEGAPLLAVCRRNFRGECLENRREGGKVMAKQKIRIRR